ncbi:MAG TPA: hypothetical protein VF398_09300, partial [bacterium]
LSTTQAGRLDPNVQLPGTVRYELLEFIADKLPHWRDQPDRVKEIAEEVLTDQLCDYLNRETRTTDGWAWIQFRTEVHDEVWRKGKIDLVPKLCCEPRYIGGRRYALDNILLPIECKRLPTPEKNGRKGRDEREYVVSKFGIKGGIQRFKYCRHGANHTIGGIIAYVQDQTLSYWQTKVNDWIRGLSLETDSLWSTSDSLKLLKDDISAGLCTLHSNHQRSGNYGEIELRHIWITMN